MTKHGQKKKMKERRKTSCIVDLALRDDHTIKLKECEKRDK